MQCVDYSAQPLPSGYELVWSRDSLQHVPMHGAWQFLNNVKASGAKYLLVGSYVKSTQPNKNIGGGESGAGNAAQQAILSPTRFACAFECERNGDVELQQTYRSGLASPTCDSLSYSI